MTLTFEQLPAELSAALQKKAEAEGRSVQEVAVEAMKKGLGVNGATEKGGTPRGTLGEKKRDLSQYVGTLTEEDAKAIEETVRWMDEGDLSSRD